MRSQIVLGGNFKVYEDGSISKLFLGVEGERQNEFPGQNGKYAVVSYATKRGKQKQAYVHRLVAQAFVPNPEGKPQVNHKDGNKRNNAAENLEWVTAQENVSHAYQTGLINRMAGAVPCSICGELTNSDSGVCTKCRTFLNSVARKAEKRKNDSRKYASIDTGKLSPTQRKYVRMAAEGLSAAEIAQQEGVSRQCVSSSLVSAVKKNESSIFLYKEQKARLVSLYRKVEKERRKVEEAELSLDEAKRRYEAAVEDLSACEKTYGCTVDELLKEE